MDVHALDLSPRFADRVAKMLERVEFRPAVSAAEREAAYRLRYEAYLRRNLLSPRLDAMLYDEVYDETPNSLTTLSYIDGELASTVRVHVLADKIAVSPTRDVFPDALAPILGWNRVIVEPSRLAARAGMAMRFPELSYFALRPPWMAAHHFDADHIVLSCGRGHEDFYRRAYGARTRSSGLRSYPKVNAKVICMALDFPAEKDRVEAHYPSFRSTPAERAALFAEFSASLPRIATQERDQAETGAEPVGA
jgi:hypothetical protein